ncbi:hypothetical protein EEL33_06985 [Muribaculaceae bacterium Isolate-037 (Harlan)]|mgnify:FL=1|nr:hypothetical protein EEL33_06985 [Muribaculaceae bacterium Isolate-037 (Harlan)]
MLAKEVASAVERIPTVELSTPAEESTYAIARLIMKLVDMILSWVGLGHDKTLSLVIYAALVFAISFGIGIVVQCIVVAAARYVGKHWHAELYGRMNEEHIFTKSARIIPAIIFLILIQFTLSEKASLASWMTRFTWIYIGFVVTDSLCHVANVIWMHVNSRANKRHLPLNGILQLVKGLLWIICVIVTIGILVNKSPTSLLAGLGAFAAVLMLVFKDSILGVVAGVQLSENDSLHEGDWIAVGDANGTVIEVSLTAVKVLNWDKTVSTLPPYSLISSGFRNYRNMSQSNTRRIQRSYMVDADSVVECDDEMLEEFSKLPYMKDWIAKKIEQRNQGKVQDAANPEGLVDGSIDTNLGVFRAYLKMYLDANPNFSKAGGIDFCFVTTLPQTSSGIPLQIYCFTSTSAWITYEAIMSALFEHMAVMLHKFRLCTFENASGRDTIIEGYLSPGKDPDTVFGLPEPFLNGK